MKSFKEFLEIVERYYEPNEPLPSGKTPYGKATSSYYRQKGEYYRTPENQRTLKHAKRMADQIMRRNNQVSRGADNPDFDPKPDKTGKYSINAVGPHYLKVRDMENDLEMIVSRKYRNAPGNKPLYDVSWYNQKESGNRNPGEARSVVRNVVDMWKNQVSPRIPSNTVLTNYPLSNATSKRNTRSKFYSTVAGFGPRGITGRQYAYVGRTPSSKRLASGASRITPLPGDTKVTDVTGSSIDDLNWQRAHKPKLAWANKNEPRKISPAKPSRPSKNAAIKALKNSPVIKAPSLPRVKPPTVSTPKLRFRGGGKVALAGAALAGAGALYNALQSKK